MATQTSSQDLTNLVINRVTSPEAFDQMIQSGDINSDEFYLVEGGSESEIYYGVCSTEASTQVKTVTIPGVTSYYDGLSVRILFQNSQSYNGTILLNVNSLGSRGIRRNGTTDAGIGEWKAGEVVDFVFDLVYGWLIIDDGTATTSNFGITKLSSSTSSTDEDLAATPYAVKQAYDLANGKYSKPASGIPATDIASGVIPAASNVAPPMDGTADVGSWSSYARGNHVHPTDTSRQAKITASGILMGDGSGGVSAATAGTDYQAPLTAGTDYATPAMIPSVPSASTVAPPMDGTGSAGTWSSYARGNHVHPSDTSRQAKITASGILKGNGNGGVSAAVIGIDYQAPKNLLHNWYFAGSPFPMNQRGSATYSGNYGYSIDRWFRRNTSNAGNPNLTIGTDGIVLTTDGQSAEGLNQAVESKDLLAGKTVTLSALIESNTYTSSFYLGLWESNSIGANTTSLAYADISGQTGLLTVTGTLPSTLTSSLLICGFYSPSAAGSVKIKAVKLELGAEQTLAYLDGSTWVLNDVPNYEEELVKCQTSTADSSDTYANKPAGITALLGFWLDCGSISSLPVTISDSRVTAKHSVDAWQFGTMKVMGSQWTVTTAAGTVTISGTIQIDTALPSTTLKLHLTLDQ